MLHGALRAPSYLQFAFLSLLAGVFPFLMQSVPLEDYQCGTDKHSRLTSWLLTSSCDQIGINACCVTHDACYDSCRVRQSECDSEFCSCLFAAPANSLCRNLIESLHCTAVQFLGASHICSEMADPLFPPKTTLVSPPIIVPIHPQPIVPVPGGTGAITPQLPYRFGNPQHFDVPPYEVLPQFIYRPYFGVPPQTSLLQKPGGIQDLSFQPLTGFVQQFGYPLDSQREMGIPPYFATSPFMNPELYPSPLNSPFYYNSYSKT